MRTLIYNDHLFTAFCNCTVLLWGEHDDCCLSPFKNLFKVLSCRLCFTVPRLHHEPHWRDHHFPTLYFNLHRLQQTMPALSIFVLCIVQQLCHHLVSDATPAVAVITLLFSSHPPHSQLQSEDLKLLSAQAVTKTSVSRACMW